MVRDKISRVREKASRSGKRVNRIYDRTESAVRRAEGVGRGISQAGRVIGQIALAQADDVKATANKGRGNAVNKDRRELIQVSEEKTRTRTAPSFIDDGEPAFFSKFDRSRRMRKNETSFLAL
jgi:hypothetical protein